MSAPPSRRRLAEWFAALRSLADSLAARRWLWVPLVAFALSRAVIALAAVLGAKLLGPDPTIPPYHIRPDNLLLDVLGSRWDTGFYLSIAGEGYTFAGVRLPSVPFFPLLPMAMRLLMGLFGGDALLAGLAITNTALLLAGTLLYRLVMLEGDEAAAGRSVWYLMIFPLAFFGSALYSESIFLLCAIGALYTARRGMWESAAMLGVGAALSRFMGLLVAPLLLVEWWTQRRRQPVEDRPPRWAVLAALCVPLGTLIYMAFLNWRFGDPLAFAHASAAAWGRAPRPAWELIAALFRAPPPGAWADLLWLGRPPASDWIDAFAAGAFLVLGTVLLRQRRWSEAVFVLLGVLVPLNSGLWMSQRRYVWVLFPAFMLLARWGSRPWVDRAITALFVLGLALFTALFAAWHWVA